MPRRADIPVTDSTGEHLLGKAQYDVTTGEVTIQLGEELRNFIKYGLKFGEPNQFYFGVYGHAGPDVEKYLPKSRDTETNKENQ